jgi:hypothetical protein
VVLCHCGGSRQCKENQSEKKHMAAPTRFLSAKQFHDYACSKGILCQHKMDVSQEPCQIGMVPRIRYH